MQIEDRTRVNARIAGAFKAAAAATGTSFEQLAKTAARESDTKPELASKTSSAAGLFQFVDQTWLELVKKEGPSVGLERQASQIVSDGKGGLTVADPKEKAKILSLKTDPLVASVMAGKFTQANTSSLTESLGRTPTDGELYAAHVLGAAGATKLVRMAATEPNATASLAFPKAAAANPALFYGKDGKPRSASDLLSRLTSADAGSRITEAHETLPAATPKLDPVALAAAVRAQVSAKVSNEGIGGDGLDRLTAGRFARAALAEKSMPGASRDVVVPTGARVDGWRAKASNDAFSVLMRSDGESLTADAAIAASPANAVDAQAQPIRMAAADKMIGGRHAVGGAAGGIPYVDPSQPMQLLAAPSADRATVGLPIGARPSRLMDRASLGAPEMPLPVVESAATVRSSRSSVATSATTDETGASGLVAPGAMRVKTVSIAPAAPASTAAASAASTRPLLPPVPGEGADVAGAPTVPRVTTGAPARACRPLDLLGLQRRVTSR